MNRIKVERAIGAPREAVWRMLTDHEGLAAWSPAGRVELTRNGKRDSDGLGAVRRVSAMGLSVEEEVTAWAPPEHYEYRLLRGAPVRDHLGRVEVSGDERGCHVTWTIEFRPLVPGSGWALERVLARLLDSMLRRLEARLDARQ